MIYLHEINTIVFTTEATVKRDKYYLFDNITSTITGIFVQLVILQLDSAANAGQLENKRLSQIRYSLSNVIMADEKFLSFHQYLRYSLICGTSAISTPSAII